MLENKPHVAILKIEYEIHRKLTNGQLSGSPIDSKIKLTKIEGETLEECRVKLEQKLKELTNG